MFGPERLRQVIAHTAAASADHLAAAIDDAVPDFTGGRITDDTAVLTLHLPR